MNPVGIHLLKEITKFVNNVLFNIVEFVQTILHIFQKIMESVIARNVQQIIIKFHLEMSANVCHATYHIVLNVMIRLNLSAKDVRIITD